MPLPHERRAGVRQLELELIEVKTELRWTRRLVAVLLALQGGNLAAHLAPLFPL